VHKLTAELADLYGLRDRGRIASGAAADIVVFDLEEIDPGPLTRVRDLPGNEERLIANQPRGIEDVLVNGVPITRDGESLVTTMRERPGHILRAVPR
jgi:N-acyl-D-amino-acid deacylase